MTFVWCAALPRGVARVSHESKDIRNLTRGPGRLIIHKGMGYQRFIGVGALYVSMKETTTPSMYASDHFCVDCGKGISPYQADLSEQLTFKSRALGDSRNRQGFTLCRQCLDRETREVRVRDKKARRFSEACL